MPTFDQVESSQYDNSRVELYRFETEDGLHLWTYTTDRDSIVFNTQTYLPEIIGRSEIEESTGDSSSKRLTISVPYDLPVAAMHVPYLPPRPVKVTVYAYQRRATGLEVKQCFVGYINSFAQKGIWGEFNCSTVIDGNGQPVPWITHTSECCWAVYEDGCYAIRASKQTIVGSFTTSDNGFVISAASLSGHPDPDWFQRGYVINTHTGERRFVTEHSGSSVRLIYPFIGLAANAPLIAVAGCDLSRRMCIDKFNNVVHRMSFDHFPDYNVFAEGIK